MMNILKKMLKWVKGNSNLHELESQHLANNLHVPYHCSVAQIEEFEKSAIWLDITKVIIYQMISIRDQLATAREHNDIIHLQGELYRCGLMLDLLTLLKQAVGLQEGTNG